jgi:hypothetical protein
MNGFDERRMLSVDSAKALKAQGFGFLNGIHYMAPASTAGVGNLCPNATEGCKALCLGMYSGQASMVADLENGDNSVRRARRAKAQAFMADRQRYLLALERQIRKLVKRAAGSGLTPVVRLNGSTDIAFERMRYGADRLTLLERFPNVQFVDYTKNAARLARAPANLSLTFSRSESNDAACVDALSAGHNVAIVFGEGLPATWRGFAVIDGDKHDLRHLDPRGVVVGLSPKGVKARRDQSGFVLRGYH